MRSSVPVSRWILLLIVASSTTADADEAVKSIQQSVKIETGDGDIYGVDISPDGTMLAATSSTDPARILVWEAKSRKSLGEINAGSPPIGDVRFARTGNTLVYVNGLGRIVVWDTRRKVQTREWPVENSGVGRFALSKNGRFMLLTNGIGAAWIDLQTGRTLMAVNSNDTRTRAVALAPDERSFATGDDKGIVTLWEIRSGKKLDELPKQGGTLQSLAFSPDGKLLAVGASDASMVWNIDAKKVEHQLAGAPEFPRSVAFTSDGKLLCAVGYPKQVMLWSMATGKQVGDFEGHTADVYGLAISANDQQLVTGSVDKSVRIWDLSEFTGKSSTERPTKSEPKKSAANEHINDLKNWEVVRGEWKQENGRIIGSGNSRLNYKQTLPNDVTLRVKIRVVEGRRPRIRFDAFHFGNEGPRRELFLHGPPATGERFPYKLNQVLQVEVAIAGDEATLTIDGKEVAKSKPKPNAARTISLETGGEALPGIVEFYDFEVNAK